MCVSIFEYLPIWRINLMIFVRKTFLYFVFLWCSELFTYGAVKMNKMLKNNPLPRFTGLALNFTV